MNMNSRLCGARTGRSALTLFIGALIATGCSQSDPPAGGTPAVDDSGTPTLDASTDGDSEPTHDGESSTDSEASSDGEASADGEASTDGDASDGAPDADAAPPSGDVAKALATFGVDLHPPMRPGQLGQPVPDTSGPLGSKASFGTIHELISIGLPMSTGGGNYSAAAAVFNDKPAAQWTTGGTNLLPSTIDTAWANLSAGAGDTSPRWALGCDVDKDGFDEIAAVYIANGHLYLRVYDDKSGGHNALVSGQDLGASTATDLDLACGDFRGDARGEIVVAQGSREVSGSTSTGKVQILDPASGYSELWSQSIANVRSVRVAAGDTDNDGLAELVIGSAVNQTGQYRIYKPSSPGGVFTVSEVLTGNSTVQWTDTSGPQTARNAGVAIGDVDGSGLPSIIVAGSLANDARYVALRVQYNAATGTYATTGKYIDATRGGVCGGGSPNTANGWAGCATWVSVNITEAFVKTVNLDGSSQRQILINETVYDKDFVEKYPLPSQDGKVGCFFRNQIWWNGACGANWDGIWGRGHVAVDVGDFDGNGVDEVAVAQSTQPNVQLFGLKGDLTGIEQKGAYPTNGNVGSNAPVLAAANVDDDSMVMVYDHHDLVFTEPIPMAVMAAPPCKTGIGQNTDGCATSFGTSSSIGTGTESSFQASATARVGGTAEVPFLTTFVGAKVEADVSYSLSASASLTWGSSYAVTKGIAYSSGPMEDTVVFTTIPYDIYLYKVLSAPPPPNGTPSLVGTLVPLSVPRPPQTFQAELGYYNSVVGDIATDRLIGTETLTHQVGDVASYPTATDRDALLAKYGGVLMTGATTVGQSSSGGATSVELDVSQSSTYSGEASFAVGATVKLTAGYVYVEVEGEVGGGFGFTKEASSSASYSGSVGTIPAASYAANQYGFGLFTYTHKDHPSKQQFPVIQYWVE